MLLSIGLVPGIILYLIFCIFLIYVFILNDASTSPISYCFTVTLPKYTLSTLRKIIGPKAVQKLEELSNYTLLCIYLVVVLGSWSIMFTFGYTFITKSSHVPNFHKYSGYLVFFLCMFSWMKAHHTSPGYITAQNIIKFDNYPYDNFLFINKTCPTVGIRKLARSKFDRFSNRHVARFDHYCGWICNTVGEENYRYFLFFLLVHVAMCIYGTIITWRLLVGEVQDRDLYNAIFYNGNTGEEVHADFWIIVHYMVMKHFELTSILILMGAMSIVLVLFFCFHLYMAANGMTTNEFYKWRQVKKWYKREKSRYQKALKEGKVHQKTVSGDDNSNDDVSHHNGGGMNELSDVDIGCVGPVKNINNDVVPKEHENKIDTDTISDPGPPPVNIYNRGIVENFKEVLFPRSLRIDALMRYSKCMESQRTNKQNVVSPLVDNNTKTKST